MMVCDVVDIDTGEVVGVVKGKDKKELRTKAYYRFKDRGFRWRVLFVNPQLSLFPS